MITLLRFYRLSKGLKAVELAEKVSISPSLLSKIETGKCSGSKSTQAKIAKALRMKKEILFGLK